MASEHTSDQPRDCIKCEFSRSFWRHDYRGRNYWQKGVAIGHQRTGHGVCIASLMPEHDDFKHISAELRSHDVECLFPTKSLGKLGRLMFLHRAIRSFKPDIIFAHATIPAIYVRMLPTTVPIVWVMHSGANDFANRALLHAERLLSSRAKAVIGVSQKQIDNYVQEIGLHPSMIVVPNGVDVLRFTDETLTGVPLARKQIVQVGRYIPEKNQLQTVEAFANVARVEPEASLLLCGVIENLAYHKAVVDRVAELGLQNRVTIEGPQMNVAQILRASTVYAMPSSFEAHSVGFLEAFAGNFASVQLLDTSDAVEYGRALLEALSQPRTTRPLNGFTLQTTADRYLAIARDVLNLRVGLG